MKKISVLLLVPFFFVVGCRSQLEGQYAPEQTPEQAQAAQVSQCVHQFSGFGVGFFQVGQTVRIVIPSDSIFVRGSANFNTASASRVLDGAACIMRALENTFVEVAVYTAEPGSSQLNQALSQTQANVVAEYLWVKAVDVRVLRPVGYGIDESSGLRLKRRVEIRFRYEPLLWDKP